MGEKMEKLYREPLNSNKISLRNRIVMPPMATGKTPDGKPGKELFEYYKARANGTALIIVEHEYVMNEGKAHDNQLSMADDTVIAAYQALTAAVHENGAKVFAQINHAGAKASNTGFRVVGPSAVAWKDGEVPHALTKEEIGEVVAAFAEAAVRVKEAGFDGVEIHSAHGYLLNQFYSPLMNKREDEYSADTMENRTRIHREVIAEVKKAVGEDFIIGIRFGACDYCEGGSEIEDIPAAVKVFEEAGVDFIDVTGGMQGFVRPGHSEPGYLKELGLAAKEVATVPVILTGGVHTADDMEGLLREGAGDLIGVGRAMMKDADWSARALAE